ncbi:class I SAM-dependent methyltransferase [Candidatus Uhrbacteria bacterium]|nr:class I SAM-dependent methyltransferase [Candidatus Uhrbacteria bacterium]
MCDGRDLVTYLDLGFTAPADQFRKPEELDLPEISYPLRVNLCRSCGLSQLSHVVDPRVLYQFDYPYESSITKTGLAHWNEFAEKVIARLALPANALVVDAGSNDGTLLFCFKERGMRVMGVDPAPNIVEIANQRGIETICAFFGDAAADDVKQRAGAAEVITGTNVYAHVDDLAGFMTAAARLLTDTGVFIFESPQFRHLVSNLEYDTIYHEHLSYLSLKPVAAFVKRFGLEVFAVEESDIHGGSFRVYIGREGKRPIDASVTALLEQEAAARIHELPTLQEFATRVAENRRKLMQLVEGLLKDGKTIAIVSTPAKGMTLLNYCGFSTRHVLFASEKARLKIGRVTPGGHIPIVPDDRLIEVRPDYALLLAWNFSKEIMANLKPYADKGGRFIIPIPDPTIV